MFQFTPLLGAQSTSPASQSLLEFDGGVKILVDVGWDDDFDVSQLKELERHLSSLSLILLTHATGPHLAAFAHCCKHLPLFQQIPIYATAPVISLGRTLLQDVYASTPLASTIVPQSSLAETSYSYQSSISDEPLNILLQPPTPDEIAKYFSLIHPLKYSQPHQPLGSPFSPPLNDLTITAYNAGHSLGGTIWHILHGMESVVYAVDWNQIRENVYAGAAWLGGAGGGGAEVIEQLRKPTALVCSARGAEKPALIGGRKRRDEILLELIRGVTAKGGTVLIPTDSSARLLELAYVLEHAWRNDFSGSTSEKSLSKSRLYLASHTAGGTMRYVHSMLEWMDENIVKEFESEATASNTRQHKRGDSKQGNNHANYQHNGNRDNTNSGMPSGPFEFKYLKMIETHKKFEKMLSSAGPKVILASDTSIDWGFSKDAFQHIARDPSNMIILADGLNPSSTASDKRSSLAVRLSQLYCEGKDANGEANADEHALTVISTSNREVQIKAAQRVPLEGKELLIYQQYLATRRQAQGLSQEGQGTAVDNVADAVDEAASTSSSSSEESNPEVQGKALNVSARTARFTRNKIQPSKENLGVNILIRQPGVYDFDVRGKKGRDHMFPFLSRRRRTDDFGDVIKAEDYLRAEEKDEVNGQDLREDSAQTKESLGQKRKWQDPRIHSNGKVNGIGSNKRRQSSKGTEEKINAIFNASTSQPEDSSSESSDGEIGQDASLPSKLSVSVLPVTTNIKIASLDFSGIHDQRSLTMLIPLIQPKKLILIGGTASETAYLAEDCSQKLDLALASTNESGSPSIFTPFPGQTVDASVDTNAWTVKLSEALVRGLLWQQVRGFSVVTLMGHLAATKIANPAEEPSGRKKVKLLKQEEESEPEQLGFDPKNHTAVVPLLDVVPADMAAATRSAAQPLHVGDLRLADLRKVLQSNAHTAEFRGEGTLLVDGLVAVRKSGNGAIAIECGDGDASDVQLQRLDGTFHMVKRKVYECLAVIAGG